MNYLPLSRSKNKIQSQNYCGHGEFLEGKKGEKRGGKGGGRGKQREKKGEKGRKKGIFGGRKG